jgi:uncharacterized protein (DUF305 family)
LGALSNLPFVRDEEFRMPSIAAKCSVAIACLLLSIPASAQGTDTKIEAPEACKAAGQSGGQGQMSRQKPTEDMKGTMGQMNETQAGLHDAMMKMNEPMMIGAMAKDADVAWICAMIPHHQGAIAMAKAGLKGADNSESKKLAEETIESNEKELKKLMAWVEKNVRRESKDEPADSKAQR